MSEIRLVDVSKTFDRSSTFVPRRSGRGVADSQVDQAFSERVAAQYDAEHSSRAGREGPIVALDQLNLTIPDGQTFAVVGPSGCGKSTLLRVVAGLEPEYTGHVYYDDQDMAGVSAGDRYIGMVFQNYALYPHFQSRGNLKFFFMVHKAPDEEAEERIRITSDMMGIGFKELLDRKPGKLSGGQQQRVAIARALVRNPRLFLFDEPLSNLDAKLRTQTRVEIKRLLHRFKITAIYVTHSQEEAIALGDQIAVMRAGRVEQVGTHQQLYRTPVNAFVAGFLGSPPMNLLKGGVVADDALALGELRVPLPPAIRAAVHAGQALTLGIRPEATPVVLDGPVAEGIRAHGLVEIVEPDFGRQTQLVYVRIGEFVLAATGPIGGPETLLNTGDSAEIALPPQHLYFFDAESEARIGA
ncbi:MAG: ATP-binding cassette domain-containing protein [Anaerolineales bacterium]|nr:ATP-binding cassette domain-containing protein [Anaerolineales bacterium]